MKISEISKTRKAKLYKAVMSKGNSLYLFLVTLPMLAWGFKVSKMCLFATAPNRMSETCVEAARKDPYSSEFVHD